jgi:predicted TIM-barrel fold metal-dependent hydrolase
MYQQRAMHMHGNQPYRRQRDHQRVAKRALWSPDDPSPAGRATDAGFRVGRCGRFEWETDGEPTYVQFLPPHMADLSAPPEVIVTSMDYAGVTTAILQNDHIYGNLAEDFAATGKAYPGRFIGLAQVDEANAYTDEQLQVLRDQVERLGMAGLYFTTAGLSLSGYKPLHDDPVYDPLWKEVARLNLPLFWVQFGASPVGTYEDEMLCLERIVQRHPDLRHVLVHGIPTAIYADKRDRVSLPEVITRLVHSGHVYPELLYPISWGGRHDYPYPRAAVQFRQLYDRFGPDRFIWGSDMPNVERFCTYRQSLTYALDYFDFLSDADRRLIFRENALGLFSRDPILR